LKVGFKSFLVRHMITLYLFKIGIYYYKYFAQFFFSFPFNDIVAMIVSDIYIEANVLRI